MHRRSLLAAVPLAALAGCLGQANDGRTDSVPPADSPAQSRSPAKPTSTRTAQRRSADSVSATFRVVDGHRPTDETAAAEFGDGEVTVSGTTDPDGCDRPVLASLDFDEASGEVRISVGGESPYGETATVECGNASYDYRCVVAVDSGQPERVVVTHEGAGDGGKTFTLHRA